VPTDRGFDVKCCGSDSAKKSEEEAGRLLAGESGRRRNRSGDYFVRGDDRWIFAMGFSAVKPGAR